MNKSLFSLMITTLFVAALAHSQVLASDQQPTHNQVDTASTGYIDNNDSEFFSEFCLTESTETCEHKVVIGIGDNLYLIILERQDDQTIDSTERMLN